MIRHHRLTARLALRNLAWTLFFLTGAPALADESLGTFGVHAGGESFFEQGLGLYQKHEYEKACELLVKAAATEPSSAVVHYYVANCLVHMKRHMSAQAEYCLSYALDPDGATAARCLEALHGYGLPPPNPADIARLRLTAGSGKVGDSLLAAAQSGALSRRTPVSQESLESLTRADRIARQLEFEKDKHSQKAKSHADMETMIADDEVAAIDAKAAQDIRDLYSPLIFPGPRVNQLLNDPATLKRMEQDIRDQATEAKERIKRQAKDRSNAYRKWSSDRHRALEQVAENMRSQMKPSSTTGGATLQAVGSDLYTRYYGVSSTTKQPIETHGSVVRIVPQGEPGLADFQGPVRSQSQDSKSAEDNVSDHRSVRGHILH